MSARTNLVLTDRSATPVAHTFTPDGDDANGVHIFTTKSGVPAEAKRFTASLRNGNGKYRASLKLAVPITQTQTINGVSNPVVVRTGYAEINFTFDSLSSAEERANLVGMLRDALDESQTQIDDLLVDLSDIY